MSKGLIAKNMERKKRDGDRPPHTSTAWIAFASGIAAGATDTIINYPPYALHYRVQRGTNVWRWRYWAPRELYRGVVAYSAIIPVTCIMDGVSGFLRDTCDVNEAIAPIISGMLAALLVSAPIGNTIVTDQRLAESKRPAGLTHALSDIQKRRGLRGYYVGLPPLLCREGIYSWSVFYAKGAAKDALGCGDIVASAVAGTMATLMSQPMDTMATFMQNQTTPVTVKSAMRRMYAENGIRRFYRGFFYRCYAVIAGVYVMDQVTTYVKRQLRD